MGSFLNGLMPAVSSPLNFPLLQYKQSRLLEACGFPTVSVGTHEFNGSMVEMYRATGERRPAVADLIGYGGAAYGGKSYGLLLLAYVAAELWPGVQIAYFRRTYPELTGPGASIPKSYDVFKGVAQDKDGGKEWHWKNGSTLYFRHCQFEQTVYDYQSQQIDIFMPDEATHFSWYMMDYLLTRNRASGDVKVPGFKPFAVMPTNPGNIGHAWYSKLFDVEKQQGEHEQPKQAINQNGKPSNVYFIPAFVDDNQIGVAADPTYKERLGQRSAEIARALEKGDWKIFAGQAFPTWTRERIACPAFEIPSHWARWRAMDYGFVHPMAMGWATIDPDIGRLYIYRALKKDGQNDTQQAALMNDWTPPYEKINVTYASPDMWAKSAKKSGPKVQTSVDEFKEAGIILTRADDDRVNGVNKIHRLLKDGPDGKPMIQVFEQYYDVFEIMETLVRNDTQMGKNPEDVKKVVGDDPFDMLKYLMTNMKQPDNKPNTSNRGASPMNHMFSDSRNRR
jgi:phage terminase large subunit